MPTYFPDPAGSPRRRDRGRGAFRSRGGRILLLMLTGWGMAGCGEKKKQQGLRPPEKTAQLSSIKEEPIPRISHVYQGARYRDPFQRVGGGGEATKGEEDGSAGLAISQLRLSGIIETRGFRIATLQDNGGNRYMVRAGRVFDQRGKPIAGVAGVVRPNRVMVLSGTEKVELVLKPRAKEAQP